jgi:acetyl-CoA C-acetyltransferase
MGSDGGPLMYDPAVMMRQKYIPQGVAADLIATIEGFSREELDQLAWQSQQRAVAAQERGAFARSIVPIGDARGLPILMADETPRPNTTEERLNALPPAFDQTGRQGFDAVALQRYPEVERIHHLHTAGNSSGLADGSALVLLGSEAMGKALALEPRARFIACATASVDPTIMLTGPGEAARRALEKAQLKTKDIDLFECNEAFASVALKFQKDMKISTEQLNVNGGAIALGHPLGATGAMLLGTLLDELEDRGLKRGLVTLCGGAGIAIATIVERV